MDSNRPGLDASGVGRGEVEKMVRWFADAGMADVAEVGGKGASLGEMYQALNGDGVLVPNGFTVTVEAYAQFVDAKVVDDAWMGVAEAEE